MDVGTLIIAILALLVAVAALILQFVYTPVTNSFVLDLATGATTDSSIKPAGNSIYIYPTGSTSTSVTVDASNFRSGQQFIFINQTTMSVTLAAAGGTTLRGPGSTRVVPANSSASYWSTAPATLIYVPGAFA